MVEHSNDTPMAEQMRSVASTSVLVSVHTSALAIAPMLRPGSIVVELLQRNWRYQHLDESFKVRVVGGLVGVMGEVGGWLERGAPSVGGSCPALPQALIGCTACGGLRGNAVPWRPQFHSWCGAWLCLPAFSVPTASQVSSRVTRSAFGASPACTPVPRTSSPSPSKPQQAQTEVMGDIHHFAWRATQPNQTVYLNPRDAVRFGNWTTEMVRGDSRTLLDSVWVWGLVWVLRRPVKKLHASRPGVPGSLTLLLPPRMCGNHVVALVRCTHLEASHPTPTLLRLRSCTVRHGGVRGGAHHSGRGGRRGGRAAAAHRPTGPDTGRGKRGGGKPPLAPAVAGWCGRWGVRQGSSRDSLAIAPSPYLSLSSGQGTGWLQGLLKALHELTCASRQNPLYLPSTRG